MSRSYNRVQIIGNLGADPEVRTTGTGRKVATLSIATSRSWRDANGLTQTKTMWHRVIVWAGLAAVVEQYVRKGSRVMVEGELEYRSYEDKAGVTRFVTEVIVNSAAGHQFLMLDGTTTGSSTVGQGAPEDAPEPEEEPKLQLQDEPPTEEPPKKSRAKATATA
jgi:single-strand DNA-binding protein